MPKKVFAGALVIVKVSAGVLVEVATLLVKSVAGVPVSVARLPALKLVTDPPLVVRLPDPSKANPVEIVISWGAPAPPEYRPKSLLGPDRLAKENTEPVKLKPVPAV